MKITAQEFMEQSNKAITLMGMSGVGKSFLSKKLETWGWHNYSCDYLIGSKYLSDALGSDLNTDNIAGLSEFVGQIGDPDKGGTSLKEFRHRQKQYYEAECAVLRDIEQGIKEAGNKHFVNDSSGSMCEVLDETILSEVGCKTVFVYLKVAQEDHAEILQRAIQYPKPLYFPFIFFDERLSAYYKEFGVYNSEEIDPKAFLSWVFPYLFESRLPKYQNLADKYGVTLPAAQVTNVKSADEFFNIIAKALDE